MGSGAKGICGEEISPREKLYLNAVAALFKDAGAGPKAARDEGYRDAMATAYASFPDDETKLFYGLAIMGQSKKVRRVSIVRPRQPSSSRRSTPTVRTIPACCTI